MLFQNPDRIPLNPGGPRESTLTAWHQQGLPVDADYLLTALDELGISHEACLRWSGLGCISKMIPEYEPQILAHKDGHYIIRDWMGAVTEISDRYDESYLRSAKDFVTRRWHRFPIESRADWLEMKQRYDAHNPLRIPADLAVQARIARDQDRLLTESFNGVFWQLREWCGLENLCILMAEEPDFVQEMAEFWGDYILDLIRQMIAQACPDRVLISEDMAYKAHSMISPAMTRQFILPQYQKWLPALKSGGCSVVELDSDGCIDELIPIWIEAGINCCSPIEVAAHCDILAYRRLYGKQMAYVQGIDKRLIAQGGQALEQHILAIVPALFADGGYIPGCDHGVPPDISWPNFLDFVRHLARLSGWL
jgi:uroporphyrinogen decarboxylase